MRLAYISLILAWLASSANASIFVLAICKEGVVAVADSRLAFVDITSVTDRPVAYADGLNKIIRLDSAALMVETGQGFIANQRFDDFVARFAPSAAHLEVDEILPALMQYGQRTLHADGAQALNKQHLAVAKFADGIPVICGFDGKFRPCIDQGYVQSSPTDFEQLFEKLPAMSALETANAARDSMRRYIAEKGKQLTMGGEFSAALLTPAGIRDLWTLSNPIQAHTVDELNALVQGRKIQITLVPPATWTDLRELLESGPAR